MREVDAAGVDGRTACPPAACHRPTSGKEFFVRAEFRRRGARRQPRPPFACGTKVDVHEPRTQKKPKPGNLAALAAALNATGRDWPLPYLGGVPKSSNFTTTSAISAKISAAVSMMAGV